MLVDHINYQDDTPAHAVMEHVLPSELYVVGAHHGRRSYCYDNLKNHVSVMDDGRGQCFLCMMKFIAQLLSKSSADQSRQFGFAVAMEQ